MRKNEQGSGTIRDILDRKTRQVIGYQALLPRGMSKIPEGCKNPKAYQQPIGPRFPLWADARRLLDAAILERIEAAKLSAGLTLGHYVTQAIKEKLNAAKLEYPTVEQARHQTSGWRSIDKTHLKRAPFYDWPPARIGVEELQAWFDELRTDYESERTGEPLSPGYIAIIAQLVSAAFAKAKVRPNPMASVEFAKKRKPKVDYLTLPEQQAFFRASEIELRDRVIAGCLMGAGLRIGELIALEAADVYLDAHDPHLVIRYGGRKRGPTKGRETKRVELFEPGLGFFRLWMRDYYAGGARVFAGERGGHITPWASNFVDWSEIVGKRITSHIMRHSYAVSMLSGLWGYAPQSLEFVQEQLRHKSRVVTERHYGGFAHGVWQRQVRHMTGREPQPQSSAGLTAATLLGLEITQTDSDVSNDVPSAKNTVIQLKSYLDGQSLNSPQTTSELSISDVVTHQLVFELAASVLRDLEAGEVVTPGRVMELARAALRACGRPALAEADHG